MQLLGLQIHKQGDFSAIYQGVDSILKKNNIVSGEVSKKAAIQGVSHSLQKMIKHERHFSVCTIDSCCDVASIKLSRQRRDFYSNAHCLNWGDMTEEYKQTLIAMIMDDFRTLFLEDEI